MKKCKEIFLVVGALAAGQVNAANWLMQQGTEPQDVSHRFFGVVQATYANIFGCDALSGHGGPQWNGDG